jgi:hypothetical protein
MKLFRRLFSRASQNKNSSHRWGSLALARLSIEALESRLVPTGPPIGFLRPPIGHILLLEFVVPLSQPSDTSHFHSLSEALGVFANPLQQGTDVVITIEPSASPDSSPVSLTAGNSNVQVTLQGDPNVPAAILPSEQLQIAGSFYTLTNLNLSSLTLGSASSTNDSGTSGNLISKCLIQSLQDFGMKNTFTQNTITGTAFFEGFQDLVTNNTFASSTSPIVAVASCDGIRINQNTFYADTEAINLVDSGGSGQFSMVANNTITMSSFSSTAIGIEQVGTSPTEFSAVIVSNNTITGAGIGLNLSCDVGGNFTAIVQGNDFSNTVVAVKINGDGSGCGSVDLGGGSSPGFGINPSLGGNDFRGLASGGFAISLDHAIDSTVTAHDNLLPSGRGPSQLVFVGPGGGAVDLGSNQALTQTQAFVQGLYNDLLGRTGTMAELNIWVNVLNTQGQAAVANGILRSSESLGRVVDSLYLRFLGRNSDATGRAAWISALQHGATLESVESGFLTSPEYLSHIDTEYVQSLYINLLGRTGSAAELAAWDNQIPTLGLAGIANGFLTSPEYRADNVSANFNNFLHRAPSSTDINTFVNMPTNLLGIEAIILSSPECFNDI